MSFRNSGPITTHLESVIDYQANEAWIWEHMALTRARVLSGPAALTTRVNAAIAQTLRHPRDDSKTAYDIADMRARIERELSSKNLWELRLC